MRFTESGRAVTSMEIGEIHLHAEALSAEVISHECCHAAAEWWRRHRADIVEIPASGGAGRVSDSEEEWCDVVGRLVGQMVDGLTDAGVY